MFAVSIVTSQVPSITWTTNLFIYKKKSAHDECTFRNNSYLCAAVLRQGQ